MPRPLGLYDLMVPYAASNNRITDTIVEMQHSIYHYDQQLERSMWGIDQLFWKICKDRCPRSIKQFATFDVRDRSNNLQHSMFKVMVKKNLQVN